MLTPLLLRLPAAWILLSVLSASGRAHAQDSLTGPGRKLSGTRNSTVLPATRARLGKK